MRFVLVLFAPAVQSLAPQTLATIAQLAHEAPGRIPVHTLLLTEQDGPAPPGASVLVDHRQRARKRLDGRPGTAYLLRPDQHVAARWRSLDLAAVQTALARATGHV
jgi:3-(3-hydroxy-phenyl)propionate hydroxylase